ncbi:hypothetical protein F1559_001917 [Cyanidiococcus yangmingshanensis]|uniref:Uncharacterized protein n=1 Tax=Cyanidiococcus yangmingshanensis TaxID=2690220 RepID=A0A7J7II34_9RHOD|nr:hypothetical protein F1559_001917 [Cyanidiococcus yangmingshanensis]
MRVRASSVETIAENDDVSWEDVKNGETWIRLAGYGSLLSASSARRTCPRMQRHRLAWVRGYRRIFCLVSLTCVHQGAPYAKWLSKEVAACAAFPSDSRELLVVAVFDIPKAELKAYLDRESQYDFTLVECFEAETGKCVKAIMCVAPFDLWTASPDVQPPKKTPRRAYRTCYSGPLWRRDILPSQPYLDLCMRAARSLGVLDSFLDNSYLADGRTCLRKYVQEQERFSSGRAAFTNGEAWNGL